jgi:hypothetical protein
MANLSNISVESAYQQFGVFAGLDFQGSSGTYIHMETNVPILSSVMMCIEAVGYNYGMSLPIRCAWNFYAYSSLLFTSKIPVSCSANETLDRFKGHHFHIGTFISRHWHRYTRSVHTTQDSGYGLTMAMVCISMQDKFHAR